MFLAANHRNSLQGYLFFPEFVYDQFLHQFEIASRRRAEAFDEHDMGLGQSDVLECELSKAAIFYSAVDDELGQYGDAEPRLGGFRATLERADLQGCRRLR